MAEQDLSPSRDDMSQEALDRDNEDIDDETGLPDPDWYPLDVFFPGLVEEWDKLHNRRPKRPLDKLDDAR